MYFYYFYYYYYNKQKKRNISGLNALTITYFLFTEH